MSWDGYIVNLTCADENGKPSPVEQAAICGIEPGCESVWAQSDGMHMQLDEIKKLVGDRSSLFTSGCSMGGKKCRVIRDRLDDANDHCINMKTKATEGDTPRDVCVEKTKKAIIVAIGRKDCGGGPLTERCHKMAEYMIKSDY